MARETPRAKKVKGTSKAHTMDKALSNPDDDNYKCVSKLAREALRDYISVSGLSRNPASVGREGTNLWTTEASNHIDAGGERRGSVNASNGANFKPPTQDTADDIERRFSTSAVGKEPGPVRDKNRKGKITSQQDDDNGALLGQQPANSLQEIGTSLKTKHDAMDDAVFQLALFQQEAKKQEEERQLRLLQLLGRLPNNELRDIPGASLRAGMESQGEIKGKAFPTQRLANGDCHNARAKQAAIDNFLGLAEKAEMKHKQDLQMSALNRHQGTTGRSAKGRTNDDRGAVSAEQAPKGADQRNGASALEAMQQQLQGGQPPLEEALLQLLNQRSVPLERVLQLVRQQEAHAKGAPPQGIAGHLQSLGRGPWNSAPPMANGGHERFVNVPGQPTEYNKDLIRHLQAMSSLPPNHHPMQQPPNLPSRAPSLREMHPNFTAERFSQAKNAVGMPTGGDLEGNPAAMAKLNSLLSSMKPQDPMVASAASAVNLMSATVPTSYDLVPETPRNDELIQRAKYLVHLSQADMSTWRTTRRRFRDDDEDDDDDDDEKTEDVSWSESKPRSKKKSKTEV